MKKFFRYIILLSIFIFAQHAFAEEIQNYHVNMTLNKDASVTVREKIDYDFGSLQKHGIFRFIPLYFEVKGQEKWNGLKQRALKIKNLSILRDGVPETYTLKNKDANGNYFIKIGNPNKTMEGLHSYVIQYDVLGSLRYFKDYDEIYWNAIGLDWKVPIQHAQANLKSEDIPFQKSACYYGALKANSQCQKEKKSDSEIIFSADNLSPHEGLTISASFPKGLVPRVEFFSFSIKAVVLGIISILIIFIAGLWYSIRRYQRKYFSYDPIHPRYTPPEGLDAVSLGYLVDKKLDPRDISAGIIELARGGYIEIEKKEKKSFFGKNSDYLLRRKKDLNDKDTGLWNFIRERILTLLFFEPLSLFSSLQGEQTDELKDETLLSEISRGNVRTQYQSLNEEVKEQLIKNGFLEKRSQKDNWYVFIPFALTFISFITGKIFFALPLFFITFISILAFSLTQLRYTKKGWETKHAIDGFKLFLEMTEKERYEFFNNPADNPQEFMEYLPYAIALGVEKKWAKQFESITIPQPEWYKGTGPFVASSFANEMSSFSQSVTSSVATKSSSGSGSGGGGFSGGGSGGGGGGSW